MTFVLPKMSSLIVRQSAKVAVNYAAILIKRFNGKADVLQRQRPFLSLTQSRFQSTVSIPQHKQPDLKEVANGVEITIPKSDSAKSVFVDYLWLYDHCRCPKCFFAYTNQKEVDPCSVTEDIRPQKMEITDTDLQITWADGHSFNYKLEWIMENVCEGYPVKEKIKRKEWNATLKTSEFPTVVYDSSLDRDTLARKVLQGVFEYGFCIVDNTPKTFEETEAFYRSLIPMQRVWGNDTFTIQVQDEYPDTAFTNATLPPHNDGTYLTETPGCIALNCLEQSENGGESFFADGRYVANLLKRNNPEVYECLTTTPIESNYISKTLGIHYKHCETVLRLHPHTKELLQIRYNTSDISPIKIIPQREIRKWYNALAALTRELSSPANQIKFRLNPGRMYIIDNWTLVHGRNAFSGQRKLAGCFMGHEDLYSRGRVLGLI